MNLKYLALLEHSPPIYYREKRKIETNRKANKFCSDVEQKRREITPKEEI